MKNISLRNTENRRKVFLILDYTQKKNIWHKLYSHKQKNYKRKRVGAV